MSRRYPVAERYEERERDFYRSSGGARSERSFVDVEDDISRPGRVPDFLREDYGRNPAAGPLVLRERERVVRDEKVSRPRERDYEKEELVIRDRRDSARPVRDDREEVYYRRDEGSRRGRERDVEETDVVVKRREQSRSRRDLEIEETDVYVKRKGDTRPKRIEIEREDVRFRRGGGGPPREVEEKEEIIYRHDERERGSVRESERDRMVTRRRERSLPPPRLVAREREDIVVRRRRSPSPAVVEKKEEIIIRRTEREPSPASSVSTEPPPPPPPEPIYRPPIVQEVITHYKGIDHGIERARSPTPPPRIKTPPKEETLEIAIRRKNAEGRTYDEEDIIFERETRERRRSRSRSRERSARHSTTDLEIVRSSRRRSFSPPHRRSTWDDDVQAEADFYNRKVAERAYIGEAYNGATKDWAIVDVPPGTRRVRMDGVGGSAQEITWQRYNGVRRSKFITDEEVYEGEFGAGQATNNNKLRKRDMWTEITKDLVVKEAIESLGYEYEETEYFYYVMEYLRYEDVMRLVEITEEIRRDRRLHLRQLQWEREELDRREERRDRHRDVYEREYIYDRRGRYR